MMNNPNSFIDPDGRDPVTLGVAVGAALVGGGLNLWSNWSKIKGFKQGLAYFGSGAAGGLATVFSGGNAALGGGITAAGNVAIDIATGNVPSLKRPQDYAQYIGEEVGKGIVFGYVGGQVGKFIGPKLGSLFGWMQQGFSNNIAGSAVINGELIEWAGEAGVKASYGKISSSVGGSVAKQVGGFADDFAKIPEKGFINPNSIRFSQSDIAKTFKNGGNIDDFAGSLKSGDVLPQSVEPIRLVSKEGMTFTLDNRRLWAFQQAGKDIPFIKLNSLPKNQLFKFTTPNNGINIIIRR